jgi:2-methylcitrate dehydratase PrpD
VGHLTESIVEFLGGTALDTLPAESVALATNGFTDCVAVMLAGHDAPVTSNLQKHVYATGGAAQSRLLLGNIKATVAQATLVGVGAAHALDFDDYAFSNHVSALLVPAILAEAERSGADGTEMLAAYIAGFETWAAVFKREPDHLHSKGWHPTGVFGPIGVVAALARLRRLNAAQTRNALGLAVASGGGVMDNFGAQSKPYQGARAAEAGVVCVELALAGVDAGPNAIDGTGGLLAALSPRGKVDLESAADWLGDQWLSAGPNLNIKMHATVGASQRCIDAAIQMREYFAIKKLSLTDVRRVVARISEKHAAVMRFHEPGNALEAKFSLEFGVAAGLLAGRVGLAEVSDTFVQRDDVQALLRKVDLEIGPDDDPEYPVGAVSDSLLVELRDGSQHESDPVHRFRGHGHNPMSAKEFKQKFDDCVVPGFGQHSADNLFALLRNLRNIESTDAIAVQTPL